MKRLMSWVLVILLGHVCAAAGWAQCQCDTVIFGPVDTGQEQDCADELCSDCPPKTGSPVFLESGNYKLEQVDLVLAGRGPTLTVARVYSSHDVYVGPLGKGWHHSLVIQAIKTRDAENQYALLRLPNGSRLTFAKNGSSYVPPVGHHQTLTENADTSLTLRWKNGTVWDFTTDGWIWRIVDRNGNALVWSYETIDGQKRPVAVQGAGNQHVTIAWNDARRIRSVTDQAGRTVEYSYDADQNLQTVKNPLGQYWTYNYHDGESHVLLDSVEFQGLAYASATYDSSDHVVGYMENGESWTVDYQQDKTVKRDASGHEWQYFFNDLGVITKRIGPPGGTREYEYNADYSLAAMQEEDGARWEYTYASDARLETATRHVGDKTWTWTVTYDPVWAFEPAKILGPVGWGGQSFRYNGEGNLHQVYRIQRDDSTEELVYSVERNSFGQVTAVIDAANARTEYVYDDASGRLTTVKLPPNNSQGVRPEFQIGYDAANRVNSLTDPLSRTTTAVYDGLDRMTDLTLPEPGTGATGFAYHWQYPTMPAEGKFTGTVTDFNGIATTLSEDVWGRPLETVDAAGNETTLNWADGLPVAITDAENNSTTYTYNELRQLVDILHPEGTHTEFTYTPAGRLWTRRDRKLQTVTFNYDELGRPTSRQYPEGTIEYTYEGPLISAVHDNAAGGGEEVSSYVYDPSFRLTQVTNDRGVIEYSWLPGDFVGGYRVDGGAWVNYTFYPSGDLHTILRQGDASPFEYAYLLSGARAALQMSNGSRVAYTWDNLDRVLTLTNQDPVGSLISRYSYEYDRDWSTGTFTKRGMRVAMTEDLPAGSTGMEKYYFDSLYELTRAEYPDGSSHQWTYDRIGNRLSATALIPGQDPLIRNYTYYPNGHGGNSQLLQSDGVNTSTWDANGNLHTKSGPGGISYYTWNSRNLLTEITAPNLQASYGYDFMSRRTGKTVNSATSFYQYVGLDLVKDSTSGVTSEYIFGADIDEILNARIGGADHFYATDALGSVRQIVDSTGQLENAYSYDAWGETRTLSVSIPNTFLYTGREAGEDGLLGYRMRYYNPALGRFVSEDPLGFGAGDASFYRYAYGDPIDLVDPLGLMGLENLPDGAVDWLADSPQWLDDTLDVSGDVAGGMGDTLSMGITGKIRDWLGDTAEVDECGTLYAVGEGVGVGVGVGLGGAHLGRNAVAQMGKQGTRLTRLGRGIGRLVWDDRRWGTVQQMSSGAMGGQLARGVDLHHWLLPARLGKRGIPQGLLNAGLNYLPISARLNRWMNASTMGRRAVEWGLRIGIADIELSPIGAAMKSDCDCP